MDIDSIRINFSESQLLGLNLSLAFIMFGVALSLKLSDFKAILKHPKKVFVGLSSQLILLPLLTLILVLFYPLPASMALGLFMAASCPGGNISNFATLLSKGNAALSVTMTSIVTISAIIMTPTTFTVWSRLVPKTKHLLKTISVDPIQVILTIGLILLLPLITGMVVGQKFPRFTKKIQSPVRTLSLILFIGLIVMALVSNLGNMKAYLHLVFFLVLIHNAAALIMAYAWSRLNKLDEADARAVTLETGVQNTALGLVLVFNFFENLGGMILVVAWWGIWDLFTTLLISLYWSRRPPKSAISALNIDHHERGT